MVQYPKPVRFKSPKYLEYVRTQRCFACWINMCPAHSGRIVPHHVSWVDGTGQGTKPSDHYTIPLHWDTHQLEESQPFLPREPVLREICRLLSWWIREGEE